MYVSAPGRKRMDVALVIRRRLEEFGLEQRDLAQAAQVTESYISQLLTGKRAPPARTPPATTARRDRSLNLRPGDLPRLATHKPKERLKRGLGDGPTPLFGQVRELF